MIFLDHGHDSRVVDVNDDTLGGIALLVRSTILAGRFSVIGPGIRPPQIVLFRGFRSRNMHNRRLNVHRPQCRCCRTSFDSRELGGQRLHDAENYRTVRGTMGPARIVAS